MSELDDFGFKTFRSSSSAIVLHTQFTMTEQLLTMVCTQVTSANMQQLQSYESRHDFGK